MRFSTGFRKYFSNTGWLFIDKFSKTLITLIVSIFVARYLGPDNYGILNFTLSFVALFSVFSTLGLDAIIVRELVSEPSKRDELLGAGFLLRLSGSFLSIGLIFLVIRIMEIDPAINVFIYIVAFSALFQSLNVIDFYFRAKVISKYAVYVRIFSVTFSAVLKLLLILWKKDLIYFVGAIFIENILMAAGFAAAYAAQKLKVTDWKVNMATSIKLLSDSWPLIFSGLAIAVYMRVDQVMLNAYLGAKAVGIYAVAARISEGWYFIPIIIARSVFPAIVESKQKGKYLYDLRMEQLYSLMVWTALFIAFPVTFLSPVIIRALYGAQYIESVLVLKIHIWAGIFAFLGVALSKYLVTENLTKINFLITVVGMITNVILNIFLIPRYGVKGAAIATVVSYFMAVFAALFIPKSKHQVMLMARSFFVYRAIRAENEWIS